MGFKLTWLWHTPISDKGDYTLSALQKSLVQGLAPLGPWNF